ncbi:MAG TPA: penicillin-binding protein 2 [Acidimicrobiales bacterium]|nr:penicillin-binding protein 2 [Acidimicrobiales bacterium]
MNKQLRRLGAGLLACYLALFAMVNWVQVFHANALNENPLNTRKIVRDFNRPRGQIVAADGAVLAKTVPSAPGDPFTFQRTYPEGDLFGHITGYFNFNFGATGVEQSYNDELSGATVSQEYQTLRDLFVDRQHTGDVTLTVRKDVQQLARDALGDRKGSVVVLDPRDGSILGLWSFPSYDPNPLASHDAKTAQNVKTLLEASADAPLRGRTWQERFAPGSTFKVVTGSVGVDNGVVTPDQPVFPVETSYKPPDGQPIQNFGGESCGGALFDILRVSCNSSFATMGAEVIGRDKMLAGAAKFGFNVDNPIDLPNPAKSIFPDTGRSRAFLGQASIGQFDTRASPLEMALVASAVANNGIIMAPHVMQKVTDDNGKTIKTFAPKPWLTAMSPQTAATMRQAMVGVVQNGTGTAAQIPGVEVAGKTGTAELDDVGSRSQAWFICFAGKPGQTPSVAVAVLVENQPGANEGTGGRVAAPIAKQLVQKVLDLQG